jgi:hypothetical protein
MRPARELLQPKNTRRTVVFEHSGDKIFLFPTFSTP